MSRRASPLRAMIAARGSCATASAARSRNPGGAMSSGQASRMRTGRPLSSEAHVLQPPAQPGSGLPPEASTSATHGPPTRAPVGVAPTQATNSARGKAGSQVRTRQSLASTGRTGLVGTGMCHAPDASAPRRDVERKKAGSGGDWRDGEEGGCHTAPPQSPIARPRGMQASMAQKTSLHPNQFYLSIDLSIVMDNCGPPDRNRRWSGEMIDRSLGENADLGGSEVRSCPATPLRYG